MKKAKTSLRVTVADNLSDTLVRLYDDAVAENPEGALAKDANLAAIVGEVRSISAQMTSAIKRERVSLGLEEADSARDQLLSRFFTLLAGYGAIPNEQKQNAAEKLMAVSEKYKGIAAESYARESALIESMLEDFAAEKLLESIESLEGIGELLAMIRSAQDRFNRESDNATDVNTSKGDSAYALKKPLLAAINEKLVPYLAALQAVEGYKAFAAKCDFELGKANASASRKKSDD